jgi:hypothetical protein
VIDLVRSPKFQLYLNSTLLVVAIAGWPLSALSWARSEPQFILGLSWLALILTSWGNLISSQVNKEVQEAAPLASADDEDQAEDQR